MYSAQLVVAGRAQLVRTGDDAATTTLKVTKHSQMGNRDSLTPLTLMPDMPDTLVTKASETSLRAYCVRLTIRAACHVLSRIYRAPLYVSLNPRDIMTLMASSFSNSE